MRAAIGQFYLQRVAERQELQEPKVGIPVARDDTVPGLPR